MCVRRLGFFNAVNRLDHIRDQHIFLLKGECMDIHFYLGIALVVFAYLLCFKFRNK